MRNSRHAGRARGIVAGSACLLLFGCGPQSADVIFGGTARSESAPVPAPGNGFDGLYTGSAAEANGEVTCPTPLAISNFRVEGNTMHFGGYNGPIAPDGTVTIPFSGTWLRGRFTSQTFTGNIDTGYTRALPRDCVYRIAVRRLGG